MRYISEVIPDNVLKLMSAEDRKALGKAGRTMEEIAVQVDDKSERKLQDQIAGLLRNRGIVFIRSRMDKKTGVRVGVPDFIVCMPPKGRFVAWEVKVGANHPTPDQSKCLQEIEAAGGIIEVIRDLARVKEILDLNDL